MFLFWNSVRVLTYLPTIVKLLRCGEDAHSHSLFSWVCWSLSNGTFALMLLEKNNGIPDSMFWLNASNTLMCTVVSSTIAVKQRSTQTRARDISEPALDRETGRSSDVHPRASGSYRLVRPSLTMQRR